MGAAVTWRVVGVSVQGTRHLREGMPCQDAHAWRVLADGRVALAVADGAGSAPHAAAGSAAAVRAAVDAVAAGASPADALAAALAAVEEEARRLGAAPRALATTLIVAAADAGGVAAAQVGDGALVVDDGGGMRALTLPVTGEFANETVFLTTPGALQDAQHARWAGRPLHLAAFSDGVQALALRRPDHAPHAPFFAPLFRFAAATPDAGELAAFLAGPRVTARADDDLTLLLAVRGEGPSPPAPLPTTGEAVASVIGRGEP
jgi:hypothetical protein